MIEPVKVATNCKVCRGNIMRAAQIQYNGGKEFKLLCLSCGTMTGSVGYNAVNGDVIRALEILLNDRELEAKRKLI